MSLPCPLCISPDREKIDRALLEGTNQTALAARYGTNPSQVTTHKKSHIIQALVKSDEARREVAAENLLDKIRRLEEHSERLRIRAEQEGDLRVAILCIHEQKDIIRLLNEVREKANENVMRFEFVLPTCDCAKKASGRPVPAVTQTGTYPASKQPDVSPSRPSGAFIEADVIRRD